MYVPVEIPLDVQLVLLLLPGIHTHITHTVHDSQLVSGETVGETRILSTAIRISWLSGATVGKLDFSPLQSGSVGHGEVNEDLFRRRQDQLVKIKGLRGKSGPSSPISGSGG